MSGRRRGKITNWEDSALKNNLTYIHYYEQLKQLAISMFNWKNVPDTIDVRFLEMTLFSRGMAVYFNDEVMGNLALEVAISGNLDVYRNPKNRRAYAVNGYNKNLTEKDSVIIYNNMLRQNSVLTVRKYAYELYELDRTIDINCRAQKTPVLLLGSEQQQLTLKNLYMQYDGNQPVIYGDKNLDLNGIKVLSTQAPYVSDKLYQLKVQKWNECLTYLGIANLNLQKKERVVTDEVQRSQGAVVASRYSRLFTRQQAAEKINKMFGTNIEVEYRQDLINVLEDTTDEVLNGEVENNE